MLLLSLLLLALSAAYCIGQLLKVELKLLTECKNPKTREEIWRHSYEVSNNGELNYESQYGDTDEPCWTTRELQINTDKLWYSNQYTHKWISTPNYSFYLFAI